MIEGLERVPLRVHEDERGWFCELRRDSALPVHMTQTNVSFSWAGVIRGLHFPRARSGRPLRLPAGDGAGRRARPRERGDVHGGHRRGQPVALYIPGRHGHGFEALTDILFCYHVTAEYDPADPDEQTIPWNDPRVAGLWSTSTPILSARDSAVAS